MDINSLRNTIRLELISEFEAKIGRYACMEENKAEMRKNDPRLGPIHHWTGHGLRWAIHIMKTE